MDRFPNEGAASAWFEDVLWNGTRCCGKCGSTRTTKATHKYMPYWCSDCRGYFSVRTGTPMARSKIPLRKWALAIYLCLTSLKSVSSMKLHRDIGVSQPAAWFMLHRIREAWAYEGGSGGGFAGPVEVDESYFGGKRANMSNAKRRELKDTGRGSVGKTAVVGLKDRDSNAVRAKVVERTDAETLQGFVVDHADAFATVYTDESSAYKSLPFEHDSVKHSASEYVKGEAHTNGVESFWSGLKRAKKGHVPQDQPEAPEPLRSGVRREEQYARFRNARADAGHGRANGRPEPSLPRPRRGQRAFERCEVVAVRYDEKGARARVSGVAPLRWRLGSRTGLISSSAG